MNERVHRAPIGLANDADGDGVRESGGDAVLGYKPKINAIANEAASFNDLEAVAEEFRSPF